jgi:predicted DNA-binding transcriptional regulator AlpA
MIASQPNSRTYSIADMMVLLNVSRGTLRSLRLQRAVPQERTLGTRTIRWNKAEVNAWIAEGMPDRETWESLIATKRVSF